MPKNICHFKMTLQLQQDYGGGVFPLFYLSFILQRHGQSQRSRDDSYAHTYIQKKVIRDRKDGDIYQRREAESSKKEIDK